MLSLCALALADFRERVRRTPFLMTLLGAVGLGYLAAPPVTATYTMFSLGGYRGTYDSAYIGTAVAIAGGLWLALAGFYVVKNAIALDHASRVGQILAATPMHNATYTGGKFLSNLMVLAALAGLLAAMTLAMQLLRGESTAVELPALLLPFLLLTLPMLAVSAAFAVLFETVPGLRGGFGNIVWFFGWIAGVGVLALGNSRFDLFGIRTVIRSMQADIRIQYPASTDDLEVSMGLIVHETPLQQFDWSGLSVTPELMAGPATLLLLAVALACLCSLWFTRFDSASVSRRRTLVPPSAPQLARAEAAGAGIAHFAPSVLRGAAHPYAPVVLTERVFAELFVGESRILMQGVSLWWLLGALAWVIAAALAPLESAIKILLPLAWLWPVLLWSRLGTQQYEHDVHLLLGSSPARRQQLVAQWAAGALLAALTGSGPFVRMLIAADWAGVTAWLAGATFIAALALALGTAARSERLFQATYLLLWYLIINGSTSVDFMGALRENGRSVGPPPALVVAAAAALFAAALAIAEARHARR